MKVEFYYDPSCPWCWVTSRWLHAVASERSLDITWKPFSLALKNDELHDDSSNGPHRDQHRASHRVLRVIEAAAANGGDRGKLYSDIGRMKHVEGYDYTDTELELMLSLSQLRAELIEAADDESYDEALKQSLAEAVAIVGDDVGVPIIVFVQPDGTRSGYFGPILTSQPQGEEALKLWDGLVMISTNPSFYELKRTRPDGGPDTAHTTDSLVC